MANLTNQNLDFISDEKLIKILKSVLDEVDVVATDGAHRSTIYLAVSVIEGLMLELIKLLRLTSDNTQNWPRKGSSIKKPDELTLDDMIRILDKYLPQDHKHSYDAIRKYRNYVHPNRELKELKPINRSTAQFALTSLNALIEKYERYRFVGEHTWLLEYGIARVPENNVVMMPQEPGDAVVVRRFFWKELDGR